MLSWETLQGIGTARLPCCRRPTLRRSEHASMSASVYAAVYSRIFQACIQQTDVWNLFTAGEAVDGP
jgi:hypothetical protein